MGTEDPARCEDRVLDELENEDNEVHAEGVGKRPSPPLDSPFRPFYDAIIGPIVDMLGPQDDELVIVPDGALCLPHGPQLSNRLGFALFHHLQVIN